MRMLLKVSVPVEAGNKAVETGTLPKVMMNFVERWKPEASYFSPDGGQRTAYFFFDLKDPSDIPSIGEPFFRELNAALELRPRR